MNLKQPTLLLERMLPFGGVMRCLLAVVFLFLGTSAFSESFKFNITFIVKNDTTPQKALPLTDYLITYKDKDAKENEYALIRREKGFRLNLEFDKEYTFIFTKDGYITKSVMIDTKIPNKREKEKFEKMLCIINLEKSPLEFFIKYAKPVEKIFYDPVKADFGFDHSYMLTPMDVELIKKRDKLFNKGWWQLHDGNFKAAKETFSEMLKKNPNDIAALYYHGEVAYKLKDNKTACSDWNAIKALKKDYADDLLKEYCKDTQ